MPCRNRCPRTSECDNCCPRLSPRPIDLRDDRPVRNLSEVHHAWKTGVLSTMFPPDTFWEQGPFVAGQQPSVLQVIPRGHCSPVYTSGENYSKRPEDSCALGAPAVFVRCRVIASPHGRIGREDGFPPHTLAPLTGVRATHYGRRVCGQRVRAGVCCSHDDLQRRLAAERDRAEANLTRAIAAERKLRAVRAAAR